MLMAKSVLLTSSFLLSTHTVTRVITQKRSRMLRYVLCVDAKSKLDRHKMLNSYIMEFIYCD